MTHPDFPPTKRIGILVFNDFEPLDVWGFVQAFSGARYLGTAYLSPPPYPFEIILISNETNPGTPGARPSPVKSYNGPRVLPDVFRDDATNETLDVLMIPGGAGTRELLEDSRLGKLEELLVWLREMNRHLTYLSSVCTGAAILARSGLLDGQFAATNHASFGWVASFGPRVKWDNVSRWVESAHYITSAGVSAGMDMAFFLVERLAGRAVAEASARAAEYDWHRDPETPIFFPQQAEIPQSRP